MCSVSGGSAGDHGPRGHGRSRKEERGGMQKIPRSREDRRLKISSEWTLRSRVSCGCDGEEVREERNKTGV